MRVSLKFGRSSHPLRAHRNDARHPLLNFRATGDNRFDAPDASFETLYVADSLEVCFGETILRGDIKGQPLVSGMDLRARGRA